jgi:hypothetical protein
MYTFPPCEPSGDVLQAHSKPSVVWKVPMVSAWLYQAIVERKKPTQSISSDRVGKKKPESESEGYFYATRFAF